MKAVIVINFKTYKETLGKKGVALAKKVARTRRNGYEVAIAPTLPTMCDIARSVNIPLFAQHVDAVTDGSYTGHISITELQQMGVKGAILNHSERKISFSELKTIVELSKKKNFKNIVCASSLSEVKKIAVLEPSYIAYEPPKLVGGNVSVTQAKPEVVVQAVQAVKEITRKTKVLCGAGIHSKEDVGQALLLGAEGVLIGHAVPMAKDPRKFLESLLL
jgi:triosephosphate isomerase (TIM)